MAKMVNPAMITRLLMRPSLSNGKTRVPARCQAAVVEGTGRPRAPFVMMTTP